MSRMNIALMTALLAVSACGGEKIITPPPSEPGVITFFYQPEDAVVSINPTPPSRTDVPGKVTITTAKSVTYTFFVSKDGYVTSTFQSSASTGDTVSFSSPALTPKPPAVTLAPSQTSVEEESNASVTITISTQNLVNSCHTPNGTAVSGSFVVVPTATTTYLVTCDGPGGSTTASVTVNVTPAPRVSVTDIGVNANGENPIGGAEPVISSGAWKDSVVLSSSGEGSIKATVAVRALFGDSVCFKLSSDTHMTSVGCSIKSDALTVTQVFIRPLKVWNPLGAYAGNLIPISVMKAIALAGDGESFYFGTDAKIWQSFPVLIAFDRSSSTVPITEADSARFMSAADSLSKLYGTTLFRPASIDEVNSHGGIKVWVDTGLDCNGCAALGGAGGFGTYLSQGVVTYKSMWDKPSGIMHELIHTLGFGHTCSWPTTMFSGCTGLDVNRDAPTSGDITYIQILYVTRKAEISHNARFGLSAILRGEGASLQGTSPFGSASVHFDRIGAGSVRLIKN